MPGLVEDCGQKGVKRMVIETGGFRELADDRRSLENQIVEASRKYGMRFIGPNCIGVICTESKLSVPFPCWTAPSVPAACPSWPKAAA